MSKITRIMDWIVIGSVGAVLGVGYAIVHFVGDLVTVELFCPYFNGSKHCLWNPGWAVQLSWGWRRTHHWRLGLRTWRD